MKENDELLRAEQGAKLFNIGVSTFYRWKATNPRFPAPYRPTKRTVLYSKNALIRFMEAEHRAGEC